MESNNYNITYMTTDKSCIRCRTVCRNTRLPSSKPTCRTHNENTRINHDDDNTQPVQKSLFPISHTPPPNIQVQRRSTSHSTRTSRPARNTVRSIASIDCRSKKPRARRLFVCFFKSKSNHRKPGRRRCTCHSHRTSRRRIF